MLLHNPPPESSYNFVVLLTSTLTLPQADCISKFFTEKLEIFFRKFYKSTQNVYTTCMFMTCNMFVYVFFASIFLRGLKNSEWIVPVQVKDEFRKPGNFDEFG